LREKDVAIQKHWYKSRTIILAMVQVVVGIVGALVLDIPSVGWGTMIKSALDILLRCDTWQEVKTS